MIQMPKIQALTSITWQNWKKIKWAKNVSIARLCRERSSEDLSWAKGPGCCQPALEEIDWDIAGRTYHLRSHRSLLLSGACSPAGEELRKLWELKSKRNLLQNNNNNKNMSKAARYRHMRSGCAHCWLFMCCNVDCWLEANYTLLHGRGKRTEFSGEGSLQTVAELTSYATLLTSLRLIYNSRYSHKDT